MPTLAGAIGHPNCNAQPTTNQKEFFVRTSFHIHYKGQCEQAFEYYAEVLGAEIGTMLRFCDSPAADSVPDTWRDKIVHANLNLNGVEIAGDDTLPEQYKKPEGFYILLQFDDEESTKSAFESLSDNGAVLLPIQKTFWSSCYGIVTDQFGVSWKLNCVS